MYKIEQIGYSNLHLEVSDRRDRLIEDYLCVR